MTGSASGIRLIVLWRGVGTDGVSSSFPSPSFMFFHVLSFFLSPTVYLLCHP